MPEPLIEKRAMRRFPLQLPIALRANGDYVHLHTENISARGICFRAEAPLAEGSDISFTMTLTPDITLTEEILVRCAGRVVRVERAAAPSGVSVAAIIERYEFLGKS
jgi:PilZ domain